MIAVCVLFCSTAVWAARVTPPPVTEGFDSDRLTRRVIAPRSCIDLQGVWLTAHTAMKEVCKEQIPQINGKAYGRRIFEVAQPGTQTVWQAASTPFAEGMNHVACLWAKRTFVAPPRAGRRVILRFEAIEDGFTVFVNGRAYPQTNAPNYMLSWTRDITEAMREGTNEVVVAFPYIDFPNCKFLSRRGGAACAYGSTRGIRGPVQVEFVGDVHVEDVFVKTFVAGGKRLEVDVEVANESKTGVEVEVAGEARGEGGGVGGGGQWKGKTSVRLAAGEKRTVTLKGDWPEARLWTPDDPFLYNLDVSVGHGTVAAPATDALRTRFGFREFSIRDQRFLLNGIPFMARAGWLLADGTNRTECLASLRQFKKRGFNAVRVFVGQGARAAEIDLMDEAGILSMVGGCTENGGGGFDSRVQNDGRYDADFWRNYEAFNEKFVRDFRNHPGVIVWSLGCEFGAVYCGQGSGREKVTGERICAAAEKLMKLDPTRTWTENGGIEVGCPVKGRGPCPTRSFHYPVPLNTDGAALPDVAYWYADGQVPWQKVADFRKPTVITEDCYHGMQDSLRIMTRFANDAVYTPAGYVAALRKGFNRFAEGYAAGGLAWWEPWMPYGNVRDNALFADWERPAAKNDMRGAYREPEWQCIPEWMIALRPFFANVTAGEKDRRTLMLYNHTFTPRDVTLVRVETLDGREIARTSEALRLDPGVRFAREIALDVPSVAKAAKYEVRFALVEGATGGAPRTLASRTFPFTAFPRDVKVGRLGNWALYATTNSPAWAFAKNFACGAGTNLEAMLKTPRTQYVVVDKPLTAREGRRLDDFVNCGGRVLLIDTKPGDWSPVEPVFGAPVRQTWRRCPARRDGFPDAALNCWRDDDAVSTSAIPKSGVEDGRVIRDCALTGGLCASLTTWLVRGKGAYLLSQAPVFAKWNVEPAAKHYFVALMNELAARSAPKLDRAFALWKCDSTNEHVSVDRDILTPGKFPWRHVRTAGPSYREIFRASGIREGTFTNALDEAPVVVMDASCGITREMVADIDRVLRRPGATVVLMEVPDDADRSLTYELGFMLKGTRRWTRDANGEFVPDDGPHARGEFPFWVVPRQDDAFAGLTADDFTWYPENRISQVMDGYLLNQNRRIRIPHDDSMMTGEIVPLKTDNYCVREWALCDPCAAAAFQRGKGRLIVSTIRFRSFFSRYERRERLILRTLLNNLGCATSVAEKVYEEEPLDIRSAFNRNFWRDPLYKKADGTYAPEAWFGDENDFRYFPVNLCGWSTAANNFCPKGVFPKQPMLLAGKRFLVQDPEKNGGRSVLYLAPGESKTVAFGRAVRADRFRLLGTAGNFGASSELIVAINGSEQRFNGDLHFGARWWASPRPQGKVAWAGETPKDPNGGLYSWLCPNPMPVRPVSEITFTAGEKCGGFVLLAVTAERVADALEDGGEKSIAPRRW